jgi:GNAT superfamily N-acetyltransferase
MNENILIFDDTWNNLSIKNTPLTSTVQVSDLAREAIKDFDYETDGRTEFYPYEMPLLPEDFGIGVIVGGSGTGKSTLLSDFGVVKNYQWDNRAIIDHFQNAQDATTKLFAVGLTSVPTWMKPYDVLSNGEKFRANLAVAMKDNQVIDEYTSVVDRNIAKAASKSLSKYVRSSGVKGLVLATVHRDILEYLEPDWIIDTDAGMYSIKPRECLRRKSLVAQVFEVRTNAWSYFSKHHYLVSKLSPFSKCFLAVIDESPAAFYAVISHPSGTVKNAFRGHRLVTLPDFQGLGLGPRLSDFVAQVYYDQGKRFFAKTAHPRLGEYRQNNPRWKATSKNLKKRTDALTLDQRSKAVERFQSWLINPVRLAYSHEFIGENQQVERKEK